MKLLGLTWVKKWAVIAIIFCAMTILEDNILLPCAALVSFEITVRLKNGIDWLFAGKFGHSGSNCIGRLVPMRGVLTIKLSSSDHSVDFCSDDREFLLLEANSSHFL